MWNTNLYSSNTSDDKKHFNEHFDIRPKNKYKVLKKIKPKYNRLVLFEDL